MSKGCRDGFCFGWYVRRGGAWGRGFVGWRWLDEGEGTEYALTLYFHLRTIGRISIKIHLYPYAPPNYFFDFNSVKGKGGTVG